MERRRCLGQALLIKWQVCICLCATGDKENHVAILHLAQMLYIWPYFMFFSFPILYPFLLNAILHQNSIPPALRSGSTRRTRRQSPRLIVAIPIMAIMLAIVHYNTIVHPFTLADNRHYMFYVFRILLRHPSIKYLAVPVYFICAWAVLISLGGLPNQQHLPSAEPKVKVKKQQRLQSTVPTSRPPPAPGTRASFLLIWLLATTLSLVTAPLVEPRYFIVPWLIWRMHVAGPRPVENHKRAPRNFLETVIHVLMEKLFANHDHRLWLETAWFLVINGVTGYIFLYWTFEWPQEPGTLQRFMW